MKPRLAAAIVCVGILCSGAGVRAALEGEAGEDDFAAFAGVGVVEPEPSAPVESIRACEPDQGPQDPLEMEVTDFSEFEKVRDNLNDASAPGDFRSLLGKFELFGQAGFASLSLQNFNDILGQGYYRLNGGYSTAGGLAYWALEQLALGLELVYVNAVTDQEPIPDFHFHADFSILEIGGFATYGYWLSPDWLVGGRFGIYNLGLNGAGISDSSTEDLAFTGSAWGFKFGGQVNYFISNDLAAGLELVYRSATIKEVEASGSSMSHARVINSSDGSNFHLEYDGFNWLAGLHFYFE